MGGIVCYLYCHFRREGTPFTLIRAGITTTPPPICKLTPHHEVLHVVNLLGLVDECTVIENTKKKTHIVQVVVNLPCVTTGKCWNKR